MSEFLRKPSWSYSQFNMFTECKRQYFYDKYWSVLPDEIKWEAWRLKYMTSLPMLKGTCVHYALKRCILDYKQDGRHHSLNDAIYLFKKNFREKYNESFYGHWKNPKKFGKKMQEVCILFEHYYNIKDTLEKAQATEEEGVLAITKLWESPIWKRIFFTPYDDFLTIDEENFPNFNLTHNYLPAKYENFKDITVYSVIDLALKYNNTVRIIDWKTGRRTPGNKLQLAVYALYANYTWKYEIDKIKFYLCFLGSKTEICQEEINIPTLKSCYDIILSSYKEMVELFNFGNPSIDDFPKCESDFRCENCRFRALCGVEKYV